MPYEFYLFLHLVGVILLVGFTFYAFAGPNIKTKKWILSLAGIASLVVLVSGFGMMPRWGFPGWMLVKIIAWLGLSAFGGVAYRRQGLRKVLMLISLILIIGAVWAVTFKPF